MIRTPTLARPFPFHFAKEQLKAWVLTLALLAQLIAGGISRGQATTSLRGTVTDSSGGYVSGASVTLTNPESKIVRAADDRR